MIGIINYGLGNVKSIYNLLLFLNEKVIIVNDAKDFEKVDKLILPGVGSFDYAIKKIKKANFLDSLNNQVLIKKKLIMGICVGMQIMFENSDEGTEKGLGWLEGKVVKFEKKKNDENIVFPIPHMGWNQINPLKSSFNIFDNINFNSRFYFLHSYYCNPKNLEDTMAKTNYIKEFCSVAQKKNIIGIQFHPEKSHKSGLKIFENFCNI